MARKFNDVMPRNGYQLLNVFLHFNVNDLRIARGKEGYDPLLKFDHISTSLILGI